MRRTRIAPLAALAASLAFAAPTLAETCHGEKVTISFRDPGVGRLIIGTAKPDVIQGGPQADLIRGFGGDDVICGGGGGDTLDGGPGRDELDGQDGSDYFLADHGGQLAEDIITGGSGDHDVANYTSSPVGITISLVRGLVRAAGAARNGGILGVERVVGTPFADRMVGNSKPNTLEGHEGNDTIDGRGGGDSLLGGDDVDTLSYATADAPIRLSVEGKDVVVGRREGVTDSIGGFEIYFGSKFDDRLVGGDDSERLVGGAGDDTLKGFGDGDTLEGGPGDDTIYPGQGDDLVDGGTNGPVTGTGAHGDLVSYQAEETKKPETGFWFELHLAPDRFGNPPSASGVGDDVLLGIESARAPQQGTNELEGDDGPNVLIGGSGIDVLIGNGGNDLLYGLGSNDDIDGNDGDDYLDGGEPHTAGDADKLDGGNGNDTCLGAREEFRNECETVD